MKKKSINTTFTIFVDWKFYLIPTILLDWNAEESYGYTNFLWLWFGLSIYHKGIDRSQQNVEQCNSQNTMQ